MIGRFGSFLVRSLKSGPDADGDVGRQVVAVGGFPFKPHGLAGCRVRNPSMLSCSSCAAQPPGVSSLSMTPSPVLSDQDRPTALVISSGVLGGRPLPIWTPRWSSQVMWMPVATCPGEEALGQGRVGAGH